MSEPSIVLWGSDLLDQRPMLEELTKHLVGDFHLCTEAHLRLAGRATPCRDDDQYALAILIDAWAAGYQSTLKDVRLAIEFYVRGWTALAHSIEQTRREREEEIERRGAALRVVTCTHHDPKFGGHGTYVRASRSRRAFALGQSRQQATEFKDEDQALDFCRNMLQKSVEALRPGWSWDDVFRIDRARD